MDGRSGGEDGTGQEGREKKGGKREREEKEEGASEVETVKGRERVRKRE